MTAKTTLRTKYPMAFQRCLPEAVKYGKCVALSIEIKANECDTEFKNFNKCFMDAMKTMKK